MLPTIEGNGLMKKISRPDTERILLLCHKRHLGVYQRVAKDLGVDPSYVSRVANGARNSEKIKRALLGELVRIQSLQRSVLTYPSKRG